MTTQSVENISIRACLLGPTDGYLLVHFRGRPQIQISPAFSYAYRWLGAAWFSFIFACHTGGTLRPSPRRMLHDDPFLDIVPSPWFAPGKTESRPFPIMQRFDKPRTFAHSCVVTKRSVMSRVRSSGHSAASISNPSKEHKYQLPKYLSELAGSLTSSTGSLTTHFEFIRRLLPPCSSQDTLLISNDFLYRGWNLTCANLTPMIRLTLIPTIE